MRIINYIYVPHKKLAFETNKSNGATTATTTKKLYKFREHQKAFMCPPG